MPESSLYFALFLAGVVAFVGGLFVYAWMRRKRRPPAPKQPYREWKDD